MRRNFRLLSAGTLLLWSLGCTAPKEPPFIPPTLEGAEPLVERVLAESLAAAQAEPEIGERWGRLAGAYHAHGLLAAAEECYERALSREPRSFEWRYLLAVAAEAGGAPHEELTELYTRAGALGDDYVPLYLRLGQAHLAAQRSGDASQAFARALEIDPDSAVAHRGLGQAALLDREYSRAEGALKRASRLEPLDAAVAADLARLYASTGREEQARAAAGRAGALRPVTRIDDPILAERVHALGAAARHWFARAREAVARGDWPAADRNLAAVEATRPGDPDVSFLRARIEQGRGNDGAAMEALESTLERQPAHVAALLMRAQGFVARGETESGLADIERARIAAPDSHEVLSAKAGVLLRLDRRDEGIEIYRQVAALLPSNPSVWFNLGQLQAGAGRADEARASFARTLELKPDHAAAAARLRMLEGG